MPSLLPKKGGTGIVPCSRVPVHRHEEGDATLLSGNGSTRRYVRCCRHQSNYWRGLSFEDRAHGLPRIKHLRPTAAVRFLSVMPLPEDVSEIKLEGIQWVIVGGESAAAARPMQKEWFVSIRDQC